MVPPVKMASLVPSMIPARKGSALQAPMNAQSAQSPPSVLTWTMAMPVMELWGASKECAASYRTLSWSVLEPATPAKHPRVSQRRVSASTLQRTKEPLVMTERRVPLEINVRMGSALLLEL
jgi:hypothetical protein